MPPPSLRNASTGAKNRAIAAELGISSKTLDIHRTNVKRKLNATVELQPDLIGGVRVVVGDEVLDTSVKARLEQMKAALTA